MKAPSSSSPGTTAALVTEIEGYIKAKDIDNFFKQILKGCFRVRPDDPIAFVFDYLVEHYPHVAAARGLVDECGSGGRIDFEGANSGGSGGGVSLVVSHPDPEVATYLNDHLSVATLFETVADRLAEDRPEKPLQHIVDFLALALDDDDDDDARRGSDAFTEFDESDEQGCENATRPKNLSLASSSVSGLCTNDGYDRGDVLSSIKSATTTTTTTTKDPVGELRPRLVSRDPSGINLARRPSVSAECVTMNANGDVISSPTKTSGGGGARHGRGPDAAAAAAATPSLPKTAAERSSIVAIVRDNILFKDLNQRLLDELIDAVFPVAFPPNHVIIKQGDEGENFYIVAEGEAEAHVRSKVTGDPPTKVQHLRPGASFGELSLMYNSPRAATIASVTGVKLWALDRRTFRRIVSFATQRARHMHEGFLERVPILSTLTAAERGRLADAIETRTFAAGECVVTQGEEGDSFYIVEEGQAAAMIHFDGEPAGGAAAATALGAELDARQTQRQLEEGERRQQQSSAAEVKRYGPGDYFGELALITDEPRAATIVAVSNRLVCVTVSKASFRRLMGSCEKVMRRNIESYKRIMMELVLRVPAI